MADTTIVNGTQLIKDSMPIQPENIILAIAIIGVIIILGFGIFWIWSQLK